MSKKLSEIKIAAIYKMVELGIAKAKVARTLGITRACVLNYTVPGRMERERKRMRDWTRRHTITATVGGKVVRIRKGLNKREFKGVCELCGKIVAINPYYHHWDDGNLNLGLWLCWGCHTLAELVDSGVDINTMIPKYLQLKDQTEAELWVVR